jgi:hypothetical protein
MHADLYVENLKGRDRLEDLSLDGRITIKFILNVGEMM